MVILNGVEDLLLVAAFAGGCPFFRNMAQWLWCTLAMLSNVLGFFYLSQLIQVYCDAMMYFQHHADAMSVPRTTQSTCSKVYDESKYIYRCEFQNCSKRFIQNTHLRRHVAAKHLHVRYKCPTSGCWFSTSYTHELTKHIKFCRYK